MSKEPGKELGSVSSELLVIADKLAAESNRIRAIALSNNHSERQKAMAAVAFISGIASRMPLADLVSSACYEELRMVKTKGFKVAEDKL